MTTNSLKKIKGKICKTVKVYTREKSVYGTKAYKRFEKWYKVQTKEHLLFGGKWYKFDSIHETKTTLDKRVSALKKKGYRVRTQTRKYTQRGIPTQYLIYTRNR